MRTPYFGTNPQDANEKFRLRMMATDFIRTRGTEQQPNPPRDLIAQAAPRGILVTWGLPPGDASDISGWRIYSPDESTLVGALGNRGTRTYTVPATSGSTPPSTNIFVSSVNSIGAESAKVLVAGKAATEAGAPSQPTVPPGFNSGTGSDTSSSIGNIPRVNSKPGGFSL